MIGDNYKIKIIDFDLAANSKSTYFASAGTKNYRAPEIITGKTAKLTACDVFSLGIIIFLLKTGGMFPFKELDEFEAKRPELASIKDLHLNLDRDPVKFWSTHCSLLNVETKFFSDSFKGLF